MRTCQFGQVLPSSFCLMALQVCDKCGRPCACNQKAGLWRHRCQSRAKLTLTVFRRVKAADTPWWTCLSRKLKTWLGQQLGRRFGSLSRYHRAILQGSGLLSFLLQLPFQLQVMMGFIFGVERTVKFPLMISIRRLLLISLVSRTWSCSYTPGRGCVRGRQMSSARFLHAKQANRQRHRL